VSAALRRNIRAERTLLMKRAWASFHVVARIGLTRGHACFADVHVTTMAAMFAQSDVGMTSIAALLAAPSRSRHVDTDLRLDDDADLIAPA
jgi:hypothetical protein